eukprot:5850254-Prymnesium_polylepis.1
MRADPAGVMSRVLVCRPSLENKKDVVWSRINKGRTAWMLRWKCDRALAAGRAARLCGRVREQICHSRNAEKRSGQRLAWLVVQATRRICDR